MANIKGLKMKQVLELVEAVKGDNFEAYCPSPSLVITILPHFLYSSQAFDRHVSSPAGSRKNQPTS